MRWPLRNQVLLPMVGVMLGALLAVSVLNAALSARRAKRRVESEVRDMARTLAPPDFPLTDRVLEQLRGLSGAEFILCDPQGDMLASSMPHVSPSLPPTLQDGPPTMEFGRSISIGEREFFHTPLPLQRRGTMESSAILHMLYPADSYREARRQAIYPPLIIGAVAVVLVVLFGLAIASRVSRPVRDLKSQVREIGHGNFRRIPVPARNDEIADLSRSINELAETLARYEEEVRQSERLRTLGQLGSGIGHQLRNSVTGCRLAIELHARECPASDEGLTVAQRQLELMENYVRRFLSLGHSKAKPHVPVDMKDLVDEVINLVSPTSRHLGVSLQWERPQSQVVVRANAEMVEELTVNLLLNAIEAAGQIHDRPHSKSGADALGQSSVTVSLDRDRDRVVLGICDTGDGPAVDIREQLFEPFVTDKPDGTGLGLSVAREIAESHGGTIRWERREAKTCFIVDLPAMIS